MRARPDGQRIVQSGLGREGRRKVRRDGVDRSGWDSHSWLGELWVVSSVEVINVPNQKAIRMAILTSKAANVSNGIKSVEEIAKITRSVIDKAML